jgi:S1-C subfamily serine protease
LMSSKSPPIVIRQSDIDKCVPLHSRPDPARVVLSPSVIAGALDPEELGHQEETEGESAWGVVSFSHFTRFDLLLALISLPLPFANALFWFAAGHWRRCDRLIAYCLSGVLFATSVLATFLVVIHLENSNDWVERIVVGARHSIVRIETGSNLGTGFVIGSEDNWHLVLTNRHVVSDDKSEPGFGTDSSLAAGGEVRVIKGGQKLTGQVVAVMREPAVDMCLILVRSDSLKPLGPLRPFTQIRQGEEVAAIGHPAGLDFTVTRGTVSAKRDGSIIQTDTALNPGNSGGPLIGKDGAVIGVNTAVMRTNEGGESLQGISFALRVDVAADASLWVRPGGGNLSDNLLRIIKKIRL